MQKQQFIATWNRATGAWETDQPNLLCAHLVPYLETWPISGMTLNGMAYALPTLGQHTTASGSSLSAIQLLGTVTTATSGRSAAYRGNGNPNPAELAEEIISMLPTPNTFDSLPARTGEAYERVKNAGGRKNRTNSGNLREAIAHDLLPTPTVSDTFTAGLGSTQQTLGSLHSVSLAQIVNRDDLLPTPRAANGDQRNQTIFHRPAGQPQNIENALYELLPTPKALDGVKGNLKTSQERIDAGNQVDLTNVAIDLALLGTPRVSSYKGSSSKEVENGAPKARLEDQIEIITLLPTTTASDWKGANHSGSGTTSSRGISTVVEEVSNWGRFAKAIERWAQVIGREAPPATKPDGKDGAHRLSPEFTEWLMGLPRGWVTEVGLTRNEALKACGNGVVPQQAALALRVLLENTPIKGINK